VDASTAREKTNKKFFVSYLALTARAVLDCGLFASDEKASMATGENILGGGFLPNPSLD
jgi:hypothetical protein